MLTSPLLAPVCTCIGDEEVGVAESFKARSELASLRQSICFQLKLLLVDMHGSQ